MEPTDKGITMSCSQEFVQVQLEERRRTTEHLHLLHSASAPAPGDHCTPARPGPVRNALRRTQAWLAASQLGPSTSNEHLLDPDHHRH